MYSKIQYNSQKVKKNERQKPKRSPNKTNKKLVGHDNPTTVRTKKYAWLPTNRYNKKRLWRLFWSKHNLPTSWLT
jgi:hypothetical protein